MRNVLLALLMAPLAACAPAPDAVARFVQPIINGAIDEDDPAVVMIMAMTPGDPAVHLCSGEVLSPHVVLTAAHCVIPAVTGANARFVVFTGTVLGDDPPPSELLAVAETRYDAAFDLAHLERGHDIGAVILRAPTSISPLPFNRRPLAHAEMGQPARLVGYGLADGADQTGASAGTRRQAASKLRGYAAELVSFQDGEHSGCQGDSGGPALMQIDGTEKIVGVTSFGYEGCPVDGPSYFTRTDANLDFIDPVVRQYDPPAIGAGQACTVDRECAPLDCTSTSAGKLCAQRCTLGDPASCPNGTECRELDGERLCQAEAGRGCHVGPPGEVEGPWPLLVALLALAIGLRDRPARDRA